MKTYWKSIDEKNDWDNPAKLKAENPQQKNYLEELSEGMVSEDQVTRRDFLKSCGYSLAVASVVASCEGPVYKAIPFLIRPEEVVSGVANYYASSYINGSDYCSILVKTREGRPIKIEGNELSGITRGGTSARVQASVLSLYDSKRLHGPFHKNIQIPWKTVDDNVTSLLKSIALQNEKIVILSSPICSPSTKQVYEDFKENYPSTQIVYYEAISVSAILSANKLSFNQEIIPNYRFDKADLIISFGADFLGTWLSPIEFTKQYSKNRKLEDKKTMSRHIQYETGMSLTGSNADERIPMKPSEEGPLLVELYNKLARLKESPSTLALKTPNRIEAYAKELWVKKGKSLIVSGSNDECNQMLVNGINMLLNNYGQTIDLNTPILTNQGIDSEMESLVSEMEEGKIAALIINNVNPMYSYRNPDRFAKGLRNIKISISFSLTKDETSDLVDYICPDNHFLESWNDAEPKKGFFSLAQPTIKRLFDTRASQESLLKWTGNDTEYYDFIKDYWEQNMYPIFLNNSENATMFKEFWTKSLQDGVFEHFDNESITPLEFNNDQVQKGIIRIGNRKPDSERIELELYEQIGIGDGKQANNPWLQELPDPISKVCWDNYASISPVFASELELENGDLVIITTKNVKIEIPVLLQPGQAYKTISIALGYGRKKAGKVGDNVGVNAFPLRDLDNGHIQNSINSISIIKIEKKYEFALTQSHHSMEGRPIVRDTTLEKYIQNPSSGNEMHAKNQKNSGSLYDKPVHIGNHWGLSIDLNACTGCSNCVIACQAENNIPTVGKEEVKNRRIMHWIRIDRYYSGSVEEPLVYHQPIMCQHCDNAPCENVCPVAATMHSDDGLNHMTYNRCIGTRYCISNCPYKARRFNWQAYNKHPKFDDYKYSGYARLVLNPDVVVRSRGVVEKCSLCVQRIQEAKAKAKLENRLLHDDEIKPACMQSCPADAIVFGNMNNPNSKLSKIFDNERNYHLLEQISVLPSIGYLTQVRNKLSM